uniref:Uncharacterized protein n=1 Tax=viral metagenome TaxID=1070528 RepID=A0A6M3LFL3_9ZZZZ
MFFAYDTDDDLEPLRIAGQKLLAAGFTKASHSLRCYVLVGWEGDTITKAEKRMMDTLAIGFTPMAMLYRSKDGGFDLSWKRFQRVWARPGIIHSKAGDRK